jgi:hypothetical protein
MGWRVRNDKSKKQVSGAWKVSVFITRQNE